MNIKIKDQDYYLTFQYVHTNETWMGERDVTEAHLKLNGEIVYKAYTIRNPRDQYVKSLGRTYALKDLMKRMNLDKNDRKSFWNQYLSRSSK